MTSLKKYRLRNSPPIPANKHCGELAHGNDGLAYESVPNKKGICRWVLVKQNKPLIRRSRKLRSRKSRSHKARSHKARSHKARSHKARSHKARSHKARSHKARSHKARSHKKSSLKGKGCGCRN